MASTDATAIPVKNQAYRITFPILDADGDLVTGATGLDSEVSKDGGTFADATSEATEIATASGMYYLDLTATEMNADTVAIIVKTSSSGAKTVPIVLYPQEAGDINVDVTYWNGTAVATPDTAGYPKTTIKSGAGTGEISLTSGGVVLTTSGVGAVADAVLDEALADHYASGSLGARLQASNMGTCQAGGNTTTVVLASAASSTDDYYNGELLFGWVTADRTNFFSDYILDYVGATRTATVTGIPVSPGATYSYVVAPGGTIPGASAPSAADNAAAVWNALIASHSTEATFGAFFQALQVHVGTAQAGGASSITLDATGSSATDDTYNYQSITIRSGTGAGQTRQITDYNGTTKVATTNLAWTTQPSTDSNYVIHPNGLDAATVASIATAVWAATRAGNATAGSFGEYVFADTTRISGDATAADNLEAMVDGTGLTLTGVTVPTVTTVGTLTTYTGNTPQTGDAFARLGAPAGASVSADVAAVKVDTAAILVDTGTTLDAALAVVDANVDAILVDTGTTLDGKINTIDTVVDAVKAKTDSLTFTAAGHVDSNLKKIAGTTVLGDGSGTPWGP